MKPSFTQNSEVYIGFNRYTTAGNIDVHLIKWYLNDTGGGTLKWGHIAVGNRDDYKIKLEHTSGNLHNVKSNSWTISATYTPRYEIIWYDADRYFIKSTDVINNGKYLKQPTYNEFVTLQTETIYAQIENSKLYFKDIEWETWDGVTGSPDDYLFNINPYSNISIPATVSDSISNNSNGTTDTFMIYPNYLRSPDGDKILTMEYNGNFIIWHKGNGSPWDAESYTTGNGMVIQTDGNVVVWGGGSLEDKTTPFNWQAGSQEHETNNIVTSSFNRTVRITNTPAFEILDINNNVLKTYP